MYVDTKEPSIDRTEPTLRDLAYVLRHEETWPEGFRWDYRYADHCGIGLCVQLYGKSPASFDEFSGDYDGESVNSIFNTPVKWYKAPLDCYSERMRMITPEVVADRIDAYLGESKHAKMAEVELDFTGRPY